MPRVAIIAGSFEPDHCGVVHYTAHLRSALAERGIPSVILTTRAAGRASEDPGVRGVTAGWRLGDLPSLAVAVRASGADLLHIQHAAGSYGFRRAVFLLPPLLRATGWDHPIVTTIHEYGWWHWQPPLVPRPLLDWLKAWGEQNGWWDREDGWLLTLSDALITTHADVEAAILARLPGLADHVHRIPLAANVEVTPIVPDAARHQLRRDAGWPDDALVVTFFGFLHPVKGLETLLLAFRRVADGAPTARLLLLGGIESLALRGDNARTYRAKLETRIAELGLGDIVRLTGYVPDDTASRLLAGTDVGVLPFNDGVTLKSGSLLALLAHGLPAVITRHEPPPPELADERVARLVPPRAPEALATALLDLLANPAARARLAGAGPAFTRSLNWPSIAARHAAIYDAALRQHGPEMRAPLARGWESGLRG